jgi:hypothetical protein
MRTRWFAVTLLCGAMACHGNEQGPGAAVQRGTAAPAAVANTTRVATHAVDTMASRAVEDTTADLRDAAVFWTAFRQALIDGDSAKLTAWTHFPLTVRGNLDDDPVRTIEKPEFSRLLTAILSEHAGVHDTNRDLIIGTTTLDSRSFGGGDGKDFFGVGPMDFQRVGERWRLTLVYDSPE